MGKFSPFLIIGILCIAATISHAQVGIGTVAPQESAILDLESTSSGLLVPRMSGSQREAISNPVAGLVIWCINCGDFGEMQVYNGVAWTNMIGGVTSSANAFQLGDDIDGEAANDRSGTSVSMSADGNRVAIGAYLNSTNGSSSGHVRIYEWDGNAWNILGNDIDGEEAGDNSGTSVSISADGNRVAIGAPFNNGNGGNSGHVRVYEWDGNTWNLLGNDIDGEAGGDNSGTSVSLSADGNRVAIGAPLNDGIDNGAGHVRIYEWDGNAWNLLGLDIDGEAAFDECGTSVSLSDDGNRVAVGIPLNDGNGGNSGLVQIYEWDGNAWNLLGNEIDGEAVFDRSGNSVSLSTDGNRVAIGAGLNDGNGGNSGHVRIFEWNGNSWNLLGNDINGEAGGDQCGTSVSMSADGNRVTIGASFNDGNGSDSGHARIFEWDGNTWNLLGLDIDGESAGDQSGTSVSISADGTRVAIGAPLNDGFSANAGHVRIYSLE